MLVAIGRALACAALGFFLMQAPAVRAQTFPSRPITIILPFAAGGGLDINLRTIARKVEAMTGAIIVVENRAGAGGTVGVMAAKSATPDGYTLIQVDHGNFASNVTLVKTLPYDPVKDFQPITRFYLSQTILNVTAGLPARTVKELAELASTKPGGLTYASQGTGSGGHLSGAMFQKAIGAPLVHVPYNNTGLLRQDLIRGRVDMLFNNYGSAKADIESGNTRVLAIAAPQRLDLLPDVPTMAEAGYPGVELETWFGLAAPAGVDRAIAQKLHDMFAAALGTPEIVAFFKVQGFTVSPSMPGEFADQIRRDIARMAAIIKDAGVATR